MYMIARHTGGVKLESVRTFNTDDELKAFVEFLTFLKVTDPTNDTDRWQYWRRWRVWVTSSDLESRPVVFSAKDRYSVGMGKCPDRKKLVKASDFMSQTWTQLRGTI